MHLDVFGGRLAEVVSSLATRNPSSVVGDVDASIRKMSGVFLENGRTGGLHIDVVTSWMHSCAVIMEYCNLLPPAATHGFHDTECESEIETQILIIDDDV